MRKFTYMNFRMGRDTANPKAPNIAHSASSTLPIRLPIITICLTLPSGRQSMADHHYQPNTAHNAHSHSLKMPMGCAAGPGPRPASWKRLEVPSDG